MKRILIVNAIPTNNGDAALVFALREKLMERGFEVTISTKRYDTVKKLYPNIEWIKSDDDFNFIELVLKKIIPVDYILKSKILFNKKYKNYDAIISAPGGYVNSYYGFYERFYWMDLIKKYYGPKLIMYSQSVGPLNDKDKKILDKYIDNFDLFMVRDEISYKNVEKYDNILKTNDAAFLLDSINKNKINNKIVGISVREWAHDSRDKDIYIKMIKNLVINVIEKGYEVEFLSTCQGIEGYVDDSKIAKEIYNFLEDKYKEKVKVIDRYFSLDELRNYLNKFNFVIGTRLHMCILSIISGVPAFNISYEVKGKECYKIMGMEEYSVDYNDNIESILPKINKFIDNENKIRKKFEEIYVEMHKEAIRHFDYMVNNIIKNI
ncbi:hypothetical protein HMPREF1092_00358 [Clostridium thermobutyricum]|uniref:Polysaccharide pyruvyl transferase domain-containing protein n=1 Tax=Clostridium thermobutyricum TaxID=29372 RepID=N9Y5X1_9CLOT|nr:polysaccharide pyruvyl transferase family protein [Clostridium thermobutyricum]ENZ03172.1 hypothetical protein HMPREF1092_00358 [Clostridium thermobutyricum]